jgi:hypothetical protein
MYKTLAFVCWPLNISQARLLHPPLYTSVLNQWRFNPKTVQVCSFLRIRKCYIRFLGVVIRTILRQCEDFDVVHKGVLFVRLTLLQSGVDIIRGRLHSNSYNRPHICEEG